jgi:hypothetical protein
MLRFVTCLAVVLSVLAIAMPVSADFVTGVTATFGGHTYNNDPGYEAYRLVDGSAMSDNPVVKSSQALTTAFGDGVWFTDHPTMGTDNWVKFDFASPTSLNEMVIWNMNQESGGHEYLRGLEDVTITYSTADATGVGHTLFAGALHAAPGADTGYTDDLFVAGGPVAGVQAVKMVYTSNFGSDPYYGLSEVRFDNGISTPEPGTIVLLTTGLLGLLAYAWRKRK